MGKTLIVVESGEKVNKVLHALGTTNYDAIATYGHIIDLDKKSLSVKIDDDFEPIYTVINDKKFNKHDVIKQLKAKYNKCDDILIATDPDREGEMIAWSIAKELNLKNPKRIKFFSTNKPEIIKSVKNIFKIDEKMVDAQKMRRILDRIVGFKLCPILWKNLCDPTLSAGRVQSVVLKLIVEKELEIKKFFEEEKSHWFKVSGEFVLKGSNEKIKSLLYQTKQTEVSSDESSDDENNKKSKKTKNTDTDIKKGTISKIIKESTAKKVMDILSESSFKIDEVTKKESIRKSSSPFETSSLQQEAFNKLGFSLSRTMSSAQNLYNAGYITYMRTDSISLSKEALDSIEKYVMEKFGKKYYNKKEYKTKDENAQEAHECIRPTEIHTNILSTDVKKKIGSDETKLYSLIWKRTIASQMSNSIFDVYTIQIDISETDDYFFVTKTENMIFDGFLKVYNLINVEIEDDDIKENINNIPKKGLKMIPTNIIASQEFKNPPKRYNNGTIVGVMKKLKIGRPATYVPSVTKLLDRKYVVSGDSAGIETDCITFEWNGKDDVKKKDKKYFIGKENSKLIPSDMAILVIKFLNKKFKNIMDYEFTADMEKKLDEISKGKLKWNDVLAEFYGPFEKTVNKVLNEVNDGNTILEENSKYLGKHPELKHKIYASIAKYGPVAKMIVKDGKNVIAPIRAPLTLDTVTLEDVLPMFDWPKNLGKWERKNVILTNGKNGYWLKAGTDSITLGKDNPITLKSGKTVDIHDFELKHAIKLFEEKKENILWDGKDDEYKYSIEEGEYGLFMRVTTIKTKKRFNVSLKEGTKTDDMTVDEARKLLDAFKSYKPKYKKKFYKKN